MEELQDAIEDAQYMNALHDVNPKPIAEWKIFPIEKLQAYIDNVGKLQPKLVTLEAICARPVGFYLVRIVYAAMTYIKFSTGTCLLLLFSLFDIVYEVCKR